MRTSASMGWLGRSAVVAVVGGTTEPVVGAEAGSVVSDEREPPHAAAPSKIAIVSNAADVVVVLISAFLA
jgi:hypothetical protein